MQDNFLRYKLFPALSGSPEVDYLCADRSQAIADRSARATPAMCEVLEAEEQRAAGRRGRRCHFALYNATRPKRDQSHRVGKFGAVAFAMAFCGSALLLGVEWAQLFDIRDFARRAPDTLNALNAEHGPSLSDIGGLIALGTFTIGWLAIAAVTIWTRIPSRMAASIVLVGFFLIPILRPILPGLLGPILGNAVLASGWTWLGLELWRDRVTTHSKPASAANE